MYLRRCCLGCCVLIVRGSGCAGLEDVQKAHIDENSIRTGLIMTIWFCEMKVTRHKPWVDLNEMSEKTDGFSCADIEYIFNCLIDKLAEHLFETECVLHITRQHLLDVIEQIKHRTQPI